MKDKKISPLMKQEKNKYSTLQNKKEFYTSLCNHLLIDYPRLTITDYMIVLTKDYIKYWIVDCHKSTRKEEFVSQNYIFLGMYAQLRSRVPQDDYEFQVWYKLLCENNHRVLFDISTEYKSKRKIV